MQTRRIPPLPSYTMSSYLGIHPFLHFKTVLLNLALRLHWFWVMLWRKSFSLEMVCSGRGGMSGGRPIRPTDQLGVRQCEESCSRWLAAQEHHHHWLVVYPPSDLRDESWQFNSGWVVYITLSHIWVWQIIWRPATQLPSHSTVASGN